MTPWTLLHKTMKDVKAFLQDDTTDPATKVELCKAVIENYEREAKENGPDPRD